MSIKSDLDKRMKEYYEHISQTKLMRRCPVILRVDGKAFHTFTKGFKQPFDDVLIAAMQATTKYLCEHIQGCVLGYHQSDEISLILIDYQTLQTDAWFGYEVQKLCSVTASMATMAFNKYFSENYHQLASDLAQEYEADGETKWVRKMFPYMNVYHKAIAKGAMFDARCFNIPKEEVTNYIYWRQSDAIRNSIQMVGQANFSSKQLHGKSRNDIKDMLLTQKDINWDDFPTYQKRGSCCIKNRMIAGSDGAHRLTNEVPDGYWFIDKEIPIFVADDRDYIDSLVYVGE